MEWDTWEVGLIRGDIADRWEKDGAEAVGPPHEKIKSRFFLLVKKTNYKMS